MKNDPGRAGNRRNRFIRAVRNHPVRHQTGEERRIFLVLFLSLFVAMLGAGVIAPTMPLYARTLGAGGLGLGLIYSSFSASRAVFMPLTGRLSDRRGRKIFITTGLTIYTLASLGYIWSGSVPELIWIRFLHGIGSAMIVPIAAAVIGDIAPRGKEGSVMGTFNVALFLGFGAGPLLGGVMMDRLGMSGVFILMGALSALALAAIHIYLPDHKTRGYRRSTGVSSFRQLWRSTRFRGLLVFRFSNAVVRGTTTAFLPILASRMEITPSWIGFLVSANILLTGVLQHFFGALADRYPRLTLIVAGNALTAIPLMLTIFAGRLDQLLLLALVMGAGSGLAFPAAGGVATEIGRDHGMGTVMGFFNQSMSLGMIAGPMAAGLLLDLFGLAGVFIVIGFAGLAGTGICWALMTRSPDPKKQTPA